MTKECTVFGNDCDNPAEKEEKIPKRKHKGKNQIVADTDTTVLSLLCPELASQPVIQFQVLAHIIILL